MTYYVVRGRYEDYKGRSHRFEVESDTNDRNYIEDLIEERYPAERIFLQGVYQQ